MKKSGIKLQRIQLINWYTHRGIPIEVGDITSITGTTGSGKSTINDALLYNITCRTTFNMASDNQVKTSGENKKRNPYRYIRAYTGETGKEYLRGTGSVTGYISLEWLNTMNRKTFLTVTVMDSPNPSPTETVKTSRYIIQDDFESFCLEDLTFHDNNGRVLPGDQFTVKGVSPYKYRKNTNAIYKEALEKVFGYGFRIDDFISTYTKTIAYNSRNDTQDFLSSVLFGEKESHDEAVISAVQSVQEILDDIADKELCQKQLAPVCDAVRKYEAVKEEAELHADIKQYHEMIVSRKTIETEKKSLESDRLELVQTEDECRIAERNLREMETEIRALKEKLMESGGDAMRSLTEELETRKRDMQGYAERLHQLRDLKQNVEHAEGISGSLDAAIAPLLEAIENRSEEAAPLYRNFAGIAKDTIQKNVEKRDDAKIREAVLQSDLDVCQEEMQRLSSGRTVNANVERFISQACAFWANRNVRINLWTIAELVEEVNADWQKTIEAYVGARREYLVCPPSDYDKVKDYWYNHSKRDVSLICINRIPEKEVEEGSVYEELTIKNPYGARYLKSILGDVIKCEDLSKIEEYKKAITKDGVKFSGAVLSGNRMCDMRLLFGKHSVELQKRETKAKIQKLAAGIKACKDDLYFLEDANARLGLCIPPYAESYIGIGHEVELCEEAIRRITDMIDKVKTKTYIDLQISIEEKEKMKETAETAKEEADKNRIEKSGIIRSRMRTIESWTEKEKELTAAFDQLEEGRQALCRTQYEKDAKYRRRGFNFNEAAERCEQCRNTAQDEIRKFLCFDKGRYNAMDHGSRTQDFVMYLNEYDRIRTENSGDLIAKLKAAKDGLRQEVCTGTINFLFRNIREARQLRKEINRTLQNVTFGRDKYELILERARQEPYKSLYPIIEDVGKAAESAGELGTIAVLGKYEKELDQFTESIIESVTNPEKQKLDDLLDYRKYLLFDIEKYSRDRGPDGEKTGCVRLSSKSASESGGEAQTAYYVILAAAFMRIYSADTIRLFVVDEAFDKMDAAHKQALMQFLKDNDLQVIVTTPDISDFGNTIDTIITVVMHKKMILANSRKNEIIVHRISKVDDAGTEK